MAEDGSTVEEKPGEVDQDAMDEDLAPEEGRVPDPQAESPPAPARANPTPPQAPAPVASVEAPPGAPASPKAPEPAKANPRGSKHRYVSYGGRPGGSSKRSPASHSKKMHIKINPAGIFTAPSIKSATLATKAGAALSAVGGFVAVGASGQGLNRAVEAVATYFGHENSPYLEPVRDVVRLGGELVLASVYGSIVSSVSDGPFGAYVRLGGGLLVAVDTGFTLFKWASRLFGKKPAPLSEDAKAKATMMGLFGLGSLGETGIGTTETAPSTETAPTTETVGYEGAPPHDPLVRELHLEMERTRELSALVKRPGSPVAYNVPAPGRSVRPTLFK